MYNRLSLIGGLFLLTFLVTTLTFSKPLSSTPNAPTPPLPVLTSDEFKSQVKQLNDKTQKSLDMALEKLLGSPPKNTSSMMPISTPAPSTPSVTTTTTTTEPVSTPAPTPAPESSSSGFNPYSN